jgi:Pyruvate/2-oxoacid:ferredoxin oxidoreductase delta subunit
VTFTVVVDYRCTACGACLVTCPERALVAAPKRPASIAGRCTGCLACIEICPRDAITVGQAALAAVIEDGAR